MKKSIRQLMTLLMSILLLVTPLLDAAIALGENIDSSILNRSAEMESFTFVEEVNSATAQESPVAEAVLQDENPLVQTTPDILETDTVVSEESTIAEPSHTIVPQDIIDESIEPTHTPLIEETPIPSETPQLTTQLVEKVELFTQGYGLIGNNVKIYIKPSKNSVPAGQSQGADQLVYVIAREGIGDPSDWLTVAYSITDSQEEQIGYIQAKDVMPLAQDEVQRYIHVLSQQSNIVFYQNNTDFPLARIAFAPFIPTQTPEPTNEPEFVHGNGEENKTPLTILKQPVDDDGLDEYATFEVAVNDEQVTFQWERLLKNTDANNVQVGAAVNSQWEPVPEEIAQGTQSAVMTLSRTEDNAAYYYRCVVKTIVLIQGQEELAEARSFFSSFSADMALLSDNGTQTLPEETVQKTEMGSEQSSLETDTFGETIVSDAVVIVFPAPKSGAGYTKLGLGAGESFTVRYDGVSETTSMILEYQPYFSDQAESVTVYLPPFFILADNPKNGDGYTITVNTATDFPAEYYTEPDADIIKAFDPTKTKVTSFTINFVPTNNALLTLSFGIQISPNSTGVGSAYSNLSEVMVAYGKNPDKIPLYAIAVAKDSQGNLLSQAIHKGSSAILNTDKVTPLENLPAFQSQNSSTNLQYYNYSSTATYTYGYWLNNPRMFATASSNLLYISKWHYPLTELVYYIPAPEGIEVVNQNANILKVAEYVYIEEPAGSGNQVRYGKTAPLSLYNIILAYNHMRESSSMNASNNGTVQYELTDQDAFWPGDLFPFGAVYADYVYKGVSYLKQKIFTINDYTVPEYANATFSHTFFYNNGYSNVALAKRRLQGQNDDQYRVVFSNNASDKPTAVFEKAAVTIELPYEVSPQSISYTAGQNYRSAHADVLPTSVTYYAYGDNTGKTISLSSQDRSVTFPAEDVKNHIVKVVFTYDIIYSATEITYDIVAGNAKHDKDGVPLPEEYPVSIYSSLTTQSGSRTELWQGNEDIGENKYPSNPREAVYADYTCVQRTDFYLITEPDALLFGTHLYSASYVDGRHRTYIQTMGQKSNSGSTPTNYNNYPWTMTMMKIDGQMKDYEDATITISAKTDEDKKALSKLSGFSFSNSAFYTGNVFDTVEVTYPTNKSPHGKTQKATQGTMTFDIGIGEYITGDVVIRFGTLHGDQMQTTTGGAATKTTAASGEVWRNNNATIYSITPCFNGYRYYFYEGVPNNSPVSSTDEHRLVATFSTSSAAKYINGTGALTNSTSTGTITYQTNYNATIYNNSGATVSGWNNATQSYYQNSEASFIFGNTVYASPTVYAYIPEGAESSVNWAPVLNKINLYLEVLKGFTIADYRGYTLLEKRSIPGSDNLLYVYEKTAAEPSYSSNLMPNNYKMKIYVQPDAPTGIQQPIVNAGYSFDGFAAEYMPPQTGENAYYNKIPYYTFKFSERNFPAYWGIENAAPDAGDPYGKAEYQLAFTALNTKLTIEMAATDKAVIKPGVENTVVEQGLFKEHNKTHLQAFSWVENATPADLAEYEVVYQLPRIEKATVGLQNDVETNLSNAFNMYLTGPLKFDGSPDELTITYFDASGAEIVIDQFSVAEELQKVESIRVYFKNFLKGSIYSVKFPLETEFVKRGAKTEDISSYVGGKRRYAAPGTVLDTQDFTYSVPAEYVFESYSLAIKVGIDRYETGSMYSYLSNGKSTVYYLDENNEEKVLHSISAASTHSYKVNGDATRVEMVSTNDSYLFSLQNASGVSSAQNSDFPRVELGETSSLDINVNHLIDGTLNQYDAMFIVRPKVAANNYTLKIGETVVATPQSIAGSPDTVTKSKYITSFSNTIDQSIATLGENNLITAHQLGTTEYTIEVKNLLSQTQQTVAADTVTAVGIVKVIPDIKVGVRAFYDVNHNGQWDEGEAFLGDPSKFFVASNGSSASIGLVPVLDEETGYYVFTVPDNITYRIWAKNPYSTAVVGNINSGRLSFKAIISGASEGVETNNPGYQTTQGYVQYDFSKNTAENPITYIDFPIETPHTVTFKAENGTVANGSYTQTESNGYVIVNGSAVQHDEEGNPFVQRRVWHNITLSYLNYYTAVTPASHYMWASNSVLRNWLYKENDVSKSEYEWRLSPVVSDMTLIAQPVKSEFQVKYEANLSSYTGETVDNNWYVMNTNATVSQNGFTNAYYQFTGWNTKADGTGMAYQPGALLKVTGEITLYAQWNVQYKVEYYLQKNDGSYAIVAADTRTLYAKVGTAVTGTIKAYSGYIYNSTQSNQTGTVIEPVITRSATVLVLRLYYDLYPVNSITKTVDKTLARTGDTLTYTITVPIIPGATLTSLEVEDTLGTGLSFISASAGGTYDQQSRKISWNLSGNHVENNKIILTVTASITGGDGTVKNTIGIIKANQVVPDNPLVSEAETQVKNPVLALAKTTTSIQIRGSEEITYTITLTNNGTGAASNVKVQEILPANATFVSGIPATGSYNEVTSLWTVPTLAAGTSTTLTVVVEVNDTVADGQSVVNKAAITEENGKELETAIEAEVATQIKEPVLTLTKTTESTQVREGEQIAYTITLTNNGTGAASNVKILETLPANATCVSASPAAGGSYDEEAFLWTVPALAAGVSTTLTVVVEVKDTVTDGQSVVNKVTVTEENGITLETLIEAEATVSVKKPILALTKTTTSNQVKGGEEITYTVTLTNSGTGAARHTRIKETLPDNATFVSATTTSGYYLEHEDLWDMMTGVAANSSETLTIVVRVNDTVSDGQNIANKVFLTEENGKEPETAIESEATVPVKEPILAITKTTASTQIRGGEEITYTITLTNNGTGDASNIKVQETLPVNTTFISATPVAGSYDETTSLWTVPALAAGASTTLTVVVEVNDTVADGQSVVNKAAITEENGTAPATAMEAEVTILVKEPVLAITKTATSTQVRGGEEITYTITLTNNGTGDASNVKVQETLPANATLVSATPARGSYNETASLWTVPTLAAGVSTTLTVVVEVNDTVADGQSVVNKAAITEENGTAPATAMEAEATVPVKEPILAINKITAATQIRGGEEITYTITLTNNGTGDASNVKVQETLPANATLVSATPAMGSYNETASLWTVPTLVAGVSTTLTVVVEVNDTVADGQSVVNKAAITEENGTAPDTVIEAEVTVPVKEPILAITKTTASTQVRSGEEITYTITLINSGTGAATNIKVQETLPANTTFVSATPAMGSYDEATSLWTVPALAAGDSTILTVVVKGNAAVKDGDYVLNTVNVVEENGKAPIEPLEARVQTIIKNPLLLITKTADKKQVKAGDKITYTIQLTNQSNVKAEKIEVKESLPENAVFKKATARNGNYDSQTHTWVLDELAPYATVTLEVEMTVKEGVNKGEKIINAVVIVKENGNDPQGTVTASAEIPVGETTIEMPKTGDESRIYSSIWLILAAAGIMLVLISMKKKFKTGK